MAFDISHDIKAFCLENNLQCSDETAQIFSQLYTKLIEFNSHTNVTALKEPEDVCKKHFIDSAAILKFDLIKQNASVLDIGCGAGFPGLPIKLLRRDIDISFLDSTAKKLKFTQSISEDYELCAHLYPERAEELVSKGFREKFDVVVSRAVASLPVLVELSLPYVKQGGIFVAYKSSKECDTADMQSELSKSSTAIKALGGRLKDILSADYTMSDGTLQERRLVVISKIKSTPVQYPRRYAAILKKPL